MCEKLWTLPTRVETWIEIIKTQIIPRYVLWTESHYHRSWFFLIRQSSHYIDPRLLESDELAGILKWYLSTQSPIVVWLREFVRRHKGLHLTAHAILRKIRCLTAYIYII